MAVSILKGPALVVASSIYRQLVCQITGESEPWDAGTYWLLWYPISIALAAITGWYFWKIRLAGRACNNIRSASRYA